MKTRKVEDEIVFIDRNNLERNREKEKDVVIVVVVVVDWQTILCYGCEIALRC